MAPLSVFSISATPTAAAVFPRATAPRAAMATHDVFTMPYPSLRNSTEHTRNGTYHHHHHSGDEMLAPLGEGELPIEPETSPPPPATETSAPPPDSMSELPIPPYARILPRAVNVTSPFQLGNETQSYAAQNNAPQSSAVGGTLFVVVIVAGGALAIALIGCAVKSVVEYKRKERQVLEQPV